MSAANKLVPELRFPEFRGDGEWERLNGNKLFTQINDRDHKGDLPVLAITQEHGAIPRDMIDYNVSVSQSSINSYKIVRVGDFIISLRSFQGGIEFSEYEGLCSPAYVILKEKGDTVAAFFKHFFKSKAFIRDLTKNLEGLRDGKMISYKQFSEVLINLPTKAEQQKIADCLGSLDELIAAHRRKLAALQDHKKGLLQQLFPAEGETTPKLRFPGFKGGSQWEEILLGDISTTTIGEFVIKTKQDPKAPYPVYNGGRSHTGFYEHYNNKGNQIVISARGANAGHVNLVKGKFWAGNSCYSVSLIGNNNNLDFVYWYIKHNQSRFTENQHAANIPSVNKGDVEQFTIFLAPPPEQQKIADCLSALDACITAQTEQIAALKEHKKGLMQKLFPSETK
jgi:type I restriction enzyme S subunit